MNDKFISRIFYILCIAHPFSVYVWDDRITRYPRVDDLTGELGDA